VKEAKNFMTGELLSTTVGIVDRVDNSSNI